jgi:uncharacterized hydrophobic protein (TIGR00271 family)
MDQPLQPDKQPEIKGPLRDLRQGVGHWFTELLDLQEGVDREGAIIAIKSGKRMRGANAWMLVCSIMIASLGLDLNSEAVIIGAMLISPLMSPILGIGLGVGTNDREALLIAIRHFGVAIFIALVTSTLYFSLTPLGTYTPMIDARTAPTILDGLVAIFGGLAGIISVTRKDKTNAIPGVAIATALMPPLCVTGYGLAMQNWNVALNSFYLFFLNSFFIALTTYVIIRVLNFPFREHPNAQEANRARFFVGMFSLLLIVPGFFILRGVISDLTYQQNVEQFVDKNFGSDCIEYRVIPVGNGLDSNLLVVQLIDRYVPDSLIPAYNAAMRDTYQLERTALRPIPDFGLQMEELDKRALAVDQFRSLEKQFEDLREQQRQRAQRDSLRQAMLNMAQRLDSLQFARLATSVHAADQFAALDTIGYGEIRVADFEHPLGRIPLFLVHWNNQPGPRTKARQEAALQVFIEEYIRTYGLRLDTFVVRSY